MSDIYGTYQHKVRALSGDIVDGHMGTFTLSPPRNEHEAAYGLRMTFADGRESCVTASTARRALTEGIYERVKSALIVGTLALTLSAGAASAYTLPYHRGEGVIINGSDCRVTHSWEDASAVAHCKNHTTWAYDPDGNALYGIAPGTWVKQKHTHKGPYGR